jgi:capsular exopolysaccharide synthesis family protein
MDTNNRNSDVPNLVSLVPYTKIASLDRPGRYVTNGAYGFETAEAPHEGKGLVDYWHTIVRNWKIVLLSSVLGLLLGLGAGIPMKPVYRASTSLEVLTLNQDFMNMKGASPIADGDNSVETSEQATQGKLLQSKVLLKRVIARLDPSSVAQAGPVKVKAATTGWRSWLHLKEPIRLTPRQALLNAAANSVKVKETAHARVLEITVDSTDPQVAADFANSMTKEFVAQSAEERWASTQNTSDWLRRELDDARRKLRISEDALQDYARQSGLVFTEQNTNLSVEKLQQVQQQLSAATADRISKQSRLELAKASPPNSLADVLNDSTLRDTQGKITDLKRQIADLSAVYSSNYSKVRRLQAELDSLNAAFLQQRSEILSRIETDYKESSRKERLLASAYDSQTDEVTHQGDKAIQYNILKREVDSNRQLYDAMLQQMKQSSIASALRASNVRVIDPADVPDVPVFPNFKINAAIGMIGGLFLSVVIILVRDNADRTLQQPGDIQKWIDVLELGAIPGGFLGRQGLRPAPVPELLKTSWGRLSARKLESDDDQRVMAFSPWQETPGLMTEAFRSVLTSILSAIEEGTRRQVLVFTSVNPAEGKTTVVTSLALAATEIGLKVLVIDADLRRPSVHRAFNLRNEFGLSDLQRRNGESVQFDEIIQSTAISNLDVVTAGPITSSAVHLLYSPKFATLVRTFRQEYDLILIDTPPMMQMTDARVAARQSDGVILVARAGQTSRDALLAAKTRFHGDRIPVVGSILNDWSPRKSARSYKNYRKQVDAYAAYQQP